MKNKGIIWLLSVTVLWGACSQHKSEDATVKGEVVEQEMPIEEVPEANSVDEATEVEKIEPADSVNEETEVEKVAPIKTISSVFANPLPGLSQKIDLLTLPTTEDVGISAYPNAHVIKMNDKSEYKGKYFVSMELVTADSVEQVLAYYKNVDASWSHADKGGVHTFKKDKDKYFRETNTLQILPLNKILYSEVDSLMGHEANTIIRIYYELDKEGKVLQQLGLAYSTPANR